MVHARRKDNFLVIHNRTCYAASSASSRHRDVTDGETIIELGRPIYSSPHRLTLFRSQLLQSECHHYAIMLPGNIKAGLRQQEASLSVVKARAV